MSAAAGPPRPRILLVTGKGGVGKTTTAAATALACAAAGHRTLVLSTDPAHSLADAFGVPIGDRPTPLSGCHPGLAAQQLDARTRLEEQWGELRAFLGEVLDWAGARSIEAEELTVLPGLEEVVSLVDLVQLSRSGDWDVLVVDCAPTAETLRLLSLPEVLSWWMERLFPLGRQVTRLVGPVVRQLTGVPVAGDPVFGSVERLAARLDDVRHLLADEERTSVRLVVTPEAMVVAEARRTFTYLALFGYHVDAVVVNRILPDDVADPWFAPTRAAQAVQLEAIATGFAPVPLLRAWLQPGEPVGPEARVRHAAALYGDADPAERRHHGQVLTVTPRGDAWVLALELPFTGRTDLDLVRRGDELVLTVGPYRRSVVLPDSLRHRSVVDASLRGGRLEVVFADGPRHPPPGAPDAPGG